MKQQQQQQKKKRKKQRETEREKKMYKVIAGSAVVDFFWQIRDSASYNRKYENFYF